MKRLYSGFIAIIIVSACIANSAVAATNTISLSGKWSFALDADNKGITEGWFGKDLPETVTLPGSTDLNKKGTPNTRQPDMWHLSRLYEYTGPAWYQRNIMIPSNWRGKKVVLFLERCHWETQVWLDGKPVGMQDSLCVPHVYDLGTDLRPGHHKLAIRVDNKVKYAVGQWAHSITEETQTNWNGIIGRMELEATSLVTIDNVQVYPDIKTKTIKVKTLVHSDKKRPVWLALGVYERGSSKLAQKTVLKSNGFTGEKTFETVMSIPNAKLWDEFSPNLYELKAAIASKDNGFDAFDTSFGMRDIAVRNKRIEVNGRKIFIRGTLECCIFPRTGYPATDLASWMRIFKIAKSYGLNNLRFHSWCPPEAAFVAADRMGFLIQVEAPQWVQNVGKDKPRDEFVQTEVRRIMDTYGNHPSFGLFSMGNELFGDSDYLQNCVVNAQKYDPRHLYTAATANLHGPHNDFDVRGPRGLHGSTTNADFRDDVQKSRAPVIAHEIGQWAVLPDLAEIPKYNGVLRARNFELYRDNLKKNNLLDQAAAFTKASGMLSVTLYKEEMEVFMRTPGHGGFELLDLHDFPGQGTALVGLLDPFWDSKGFITPEEYRRFCGPTVPLLRMSKRTFTTDETFTAKAEISHFGPKDIAKAVPLWSITDQKGAVVASGTLPDRKLPTGDLHDLGDISVPLANATAPGEFTVTLSLKGTNIANDWHIWVYPANIDTTPPQDVFVTRSGDEAKQALGQGKTVLMLASQNWLADSRKGSFTPIFWSPVLFSSQVNTGMGILCDPNHGALAAFPTDSYTNWQWDDLLTKSRTMVLDSTPSDFRPIIQVIDNFTKNQKLGVLLEAKVGNGRLMLCSINLWSDLDKRPVARQLLWSIQNYMRTPSFNPRQSLTVEELDKIIAVPQMPVLTTLGATATVDSEDTESGCIATNAIDDEPGTIWHTKWQGASPPFPHELRIDAKQSIEISGFTYLPRQDIDHGWIADYEFYVSENGTDWGAPVAKGKFKKMDTYSLNIAKKTVNFEKPVRGRYLKLIALTGMSDQPHASIAEFDVILVKPEGK